MSIETMQKLSMAFFILAVALFIISLILFFTFRIPKLIKELTGIAANKGIKNISFKSSQGESGILHTGRKHHENIMTLSGNLKSPGDRNEMKSGETRKLKTKELKNDKEKTPETTVLISNDQIGNAARKQRLSNYVIPVKSPDTKFNVIYRENYMSSSEIIQ